MLSNNEARVKCTNYSIKLIEELTICKVEVKRFSISVIFVQVARRLESGNRSSSTGECEELLGLQNRFKFGVYSFVLVRFALLTTDSCW